MYLRCRPYDAREAQYVRTSMELLAARLGLPLPDVYADHGLSTRGPLPSLEHLVSAAEQGWVDVVLVPGPFVFALDDRAAADTVRRLARAGCEVVEAPGRVVRPRGVLRDGVAAYGVRGCDGPAHDVRPARDGAGPGPGPAAYQAV